VSLDFLPFLHRKHARCWRTDGSKIEHRQAGRPRDRQTCPPSSAAEDHPVVDGVKDAPRILRLHGAIGHRLVDRLERVAPARQSQAPFVVTAKARCPVAFW
jgi:hypothetical protein